MLINEDLQALLPAIVLEIAELIGLPNALILCEKLGGLDFDVPVHEKARHADLLVGLVGKTATIAMIERFAGERIYIPRCHDYMIAIRNQSFIDAVHGMMEKGVKQKQAIQQLAPQFGFTERWAYEILNRQRTTQMDLF